MSKLRGLPSVDRLLQTSQAADLIAAYGRPLTLAALRSSMEQIRLRDPGEDLPKIEKILEQAATQLGEWLRPSLVPVINASGVILHTTLGRAPLSQAATQAIQRPTGQPRSARPGIAKPADRRRGGPGG